MTRSTDTGRQDGNGSLSLDEFGQMMDRTPLRARYSDRQIAKIFGELASQDGILTKRDWLSLFRYVEVPTRAHLCPSQRLCLL